MFNDPAQIYHYLMSNDSHFLNSENFQRRFLYEYPRLLWQTEKIEDLGDFVLLFPNPDRKLQEDFLKSSDNGILLEEAEEIFR